MQTSRSGRKRRLITAAIAALGLTGAAAVQAPVAEAGTYHHYICQTPGGDVAGSDGIELFNPQGAEQIANTCVGTNPNGRELFIAASTSSSVGYMNGLRYFAPSNTTIAQAQFHRVMYRSTMAADGPSASWTSWLSSNQPSFAGAFESCGTGCKGKGFPNSDVVDPIVSSGPLANSTALYLMTGCVGSGFCPDGQFAVNNIRRIDVEISDVNSPTASNLTGALAGSSAHRGTETATFNAADLGGGLYYKQVEIKTPAEQNFKVLSRELVDDNEGKCAELNHLPTDNHEFNYRQPCKLASTESVSLDTTGYDDGTYHVRVRLEDAAGNFGTVVDNDQFAIDNVPPPVNTALPAVTGTPRNGQTLTSSNGEWTGSSISYSRQWQRCTGGTCSTIAGATDVTYTVTSADVDHTIRVVVTATNIEGATNANSAAVGPVLPPPGNTALPTISGQAHNGQVLSAGKGTWTGADNAYAYEWQRCIDASNCEPIAGATSPTYTVAGADISRSIRVAVTATNLEGATTANSALVGPIAPPPANSTLPTITGTPRNGQTLTADKGTWTGQNITFAYQWQRCTTAETPVCEAITGATNATYKVAAADANKTLRIVVTGTSLDGASSATSAATTPINPAPANTVKPKIEGTAKVGETLTSDRGTWAGTGLSYGYQWQRCADKNDVATCLAIDGAAEATYKAVGEDKEQFLRVVVTATNLDGTTSSASDLTGSVAGSNPGSCNACNPEPAPEAPPGVNPGAVNGTGGNVDSARFTSESRKTVRSRYGAKKTVGGRLVDANGVPIAGARVEITDGKTIATVITDGQGNYSYTLLKGVSRQVTFAYRKTLGADVFSDTAVVTVRIAGVLKLKAKQKVIPAKGKMQLVGRLMGAGKGAQVQVQARDGRKWRTIDVVVTNAKGKVGYAYKFKRVTAATFLFRMKMTSQPKVKLEGTTSKPVKVRVK